jgi:hypothetical protein
MKKALSIGFTLAVFLAVMAAGASDTSWVQAEKNAAQSQRAIQFCRRYVLGWLAHADSGSGLIPRNLTGDSNWNAEDAAADNYPFMVLTAHLVDRSMEYIFKKQRYDGVLEGWHGDGNSARTALLWALQKTQGVSASKYTPRSPQKAAAWQ